MKLSKETVGLLKNFAGINSNLLIKAGNKLSTISGAKNVMSSATVAEFFAADFGIYDLNEFLGAMSLFEDPDLKFSEKFVTITQDSNSIRYFAAEASVLSAPTREINFPESDVDFTLTSSMLDMIKKTSAVLNVSDLSIVGDGSTLTAVVCDKKNASGNSYNTLLVCGSINKIFKVNLKVENLKMFPGDYMVSISSKKISRFKAINSDLVYYIAIEADSTFEV